MSPRVEGKESGKGEEKTGRGRKGKEKGGDKPAVYGPNMKP